MHDISVYESAGGCVAVINDSAIVLTALSQDEIVTYLVERGVALNNFPLTIRAPRAIGIAMFKRYVAERYADEDLLGVLKDDGTMYTMVKDTHTLIGADKESAHHVFLELA